MEVVWTESSDGYRNDLNREVPFRVVSVSLANGETETH